LNQTINACCQHANSRDAGGFRRFTLNKIIKIEQNKKLQQVIRATAAGGQALGIIAKKLRIW
jgi:hypothetical protein